MVRLWAFIGMLIQVRNVPWIQYIKRENKWNLLNPTLVRKETVLDCQVVGLERLKCTEILSVQDDSGLYRCRFRQVPVPTNIIYYFHAFLRFHFRLLQKGFSKETMATGLCGCL